MSLDEMQYRAILNARLIAKDVLDSAYAHPMRSSFHDFVAFLVQHGLLAEDHGQSLRQGRSIDTGGLEQPDRSGSSLSLDQVEKLCQDRFHSNPLFSPHARLQYDLLEKLGEGGMGVVHRIKDKKLGRSAALKVLASVNNERAAARFIREARITASLVHPNIPPIYELGMNSSGEHYMLMKVIEGQSLRQAIREVHGGGKADPKETRRLLEALVKVCEAMAYAHSKNVIHRDLKPENIMIGEFGEVMVLDWGLARQLDAEDDIDLDNPESLQLREAAQKEGLTGAGDLLGTVGYMAPEQIDGQACKQSDVFALGAILTEILTGKKAVAGNSVIEKMSATVQGRIEGPLDLSLDASPELDALAVEALAADLEQRTEAVTDFSEDLRAYLIGDLLECYDYSVWERMRRSVSRHATGFVSLTFVLVIVFVSAYSQVSLEKAQLGRATSKVLEKEALDLERRLEKSSRRLDELDGRWEELSPSELKAAVEDAVELGGRSESQLLRASRILLKAKQLLSAEKLLSEIVAKNPLSFDAMNLLHEIEVGNGAEITGASKWAVEMERVALENGIENEYSLLAMAGKSYLNRDFKKTLELLSRAETYSQTYFMTHYLRACILEEMGRLEEAVDSYSRAILHGNGSGILYLNRGCIYLKLNKLALAKKDFSVAIAIKPDYAEAYCNRGVVNLRLGRLEDSFRDYSQAIRLNPNFAAAMTNRGDLQLEFNDVKGAVNDFKRALVIDPKQGAAHLGIGIAFEKLGTLDKAMESYCQALTLEPSLEKAWFYRGDLRRRNGDLNGAMADINSGLSKSPQSALGYYRRAQVWVDMGKKREAALDCEQSLRFQPNDPQGAEKRRFIRHYLGRDSKH